MKVLDISRLIAPGSLVYPGDPPVSIRRYCRIPDSPFNMLHLGLTTHVLTHIDAPLHFCAEGPAIDALAPERFFGAARVIEVEGSAVLPEHVPEDAFGLNLLFKTRNSRKWDSREYDPNHVFITAEAARTIVQSGANLAGIDYLSVDPFGDDTFPAHRILLGAGVLILEGIDLSAAPPGDYTLIAMPLRIEQGDGSPVRAVLLPAGTDPL